MPWKYRMYPNLVLSPPISFEWQIETAMHLIKKWIYKLQFRVRHLFNIFQEKKIIYFRFFLKPRPNVLCALYYKNTDKIYCIQAPFNCQFVNNNFKKGNNLIENQSLALSNMACQCVWKLNQWTTIVNKYYKLKKVSSINLLLAYKQARWLIGKSSAWY